jgi:phosphoribosylanthranilate isomerase
MKVWFSADEIGPPRVKLCGMTRREDAVAAADLGADAVGFVFWEQSPRTVSPEAVRDIVRALPPSLDKVGVFVNGDLKRMAEIAAYAGLTTVQLHGDESPNVADVAGVATIKAIAAPAGALSAADAMEAAACQAGAWPDHITLLVDARDAERRGGTGRRANWAFANALTCMRPVILAGGISPETVIEAIHRVLPFAVDASSGIESSPGVKDRGRMRDLLAAVKHGWGFLQMNADERWRARVQFRDAARQGLGRARTSDLSSGLMR